MQAEPITEKLIAAIESGEYDFLQCNLPNPDMVGHTGNFEAAVVACQTVDACVGRLYQVCKEQGVNLIITADHGNAEEMQDEKGKTKTSHTNNLVPLIICPFGTPDVKLQEGEFGLTNLAATVCTLMGVPANSNFNPSVIKLS